MSVTAFALRHDRLVLFAAVLVTFAGLVSYLSFPSQEEPTLPVRTAVVTAYQPALPPARMEDLVARPLEQRVRELAEVRHITTTVRSGFLLMKVEIKAGRPLDMAWQRLREKVADVRNAGLLPDGTQGPFIDDDFGRVAVATIAVRAPGFTWAEIREHVTRLRDRLTGLDGVERVSLHGLRAERVYLETSSARIARFGLDPSALARTLERQNVILSGGEVDLGGGLSARIDPTGEIRSLDNLRALPIALPRGGTAYLGDLVTVRRDLVEPLEIAATFDGEPTVIVAVSMAPGRAIELFGEALHRRVAELGQLLPVGFTLDTVTFQPEVVRDAVGDVTTTLYQTIAVVLVATVLFLGLRIGLIVGLLTPITMLAALLIMRPLGIELHSVSLAAFIIALGILVDNGTVVAEDVARRLAAGEERGVAALGAGTTLTMPLLVATLTAVLAFLPPRLSIEPAAQYAHALSEVMAITLLVSWLLAVTLTPLLSRILAKAPQGNAGDANADEDVAYQRGFYRLYRAALEWVLRHTLVYTGGLLVALAAAIFALAVLVPVEFLPNSRRPQIQITLELAPGTTAGATKATVDALSRRLNDREAFPEIRNHVAYVGEGGPRFILSLNPPDPAPHRAYIVANVVKDTNLVALTRRLREDIAARFPEVRAEPKPFSYGETEAGLVVVRLSGPETEVLLGAADRLKAALRAVPGTVDVRDDWEAPVPRLLVRVDQERARRAGATTQDVAQSLQGILSGADVTVYREGDQIIPVVWRTPEGERRSLDRIWSATVFTEGGGSVPLAQVADVQLVPSPNVIQRRDLERTVTVSAANPGLAAAQLLAAVGPTLDGLGLPLGYRITYGGEIEESERSNDAILGYFPLCFAGIVLLFVYQFNSIRKVGIVLAGMPFCLIGAAAGLVATGISFDFMAVLGMLALMGTIVSNATLVLERIDEELALGKPPYEALVAAAVKRLRPVVITQLTTILGLIPFMLENNPLWDAFNIVVAGGLTAGTLVTLGLVPVLYAWLFRVQPQDRSTAKASSP